MEKYLKILKLSSLFKDISETELLPLLGCLGATVRSYKKNSVILSAGDSTKCLGIVLTGSAQIAQTDYYGNRSIMTHIETAQIFGETFACAEVTALPVDVIACEDCEIMFIDVQHITNACCNACSFHNRMIFNLMRLVAAHNLVLHRKIEITSKRTTREKLLTYLSHEAIKNKSATFDIPYDRQQLADYLQVERSGLSAEISKLRAEGKLIANKNRFTLLQT